MIDPIAKILRSHIRRGVVGALGLTVVASAPLAAQAGSPDFTCRNSAAEITCTGRTCEINRDGFTPMGVSKEGNRIEVCAYSACSSGAIDLRRRRGDHLILHATLARGQGGATIVYDQRQKMATLLWGKYAQPMSCGGEGAL